MSTVATNKLQGLSEADFVELPVGSFDSNTMEQVTVSGKKLIRVKGSPAGSVGNTSLAANSVSTDKIQDFAVTGIKIGIEAVGTSNLADGSVTGSKVAEGSLTSDKFDPSFLEAIQSGGVEGTAVALQRTTFERRLSALTDADTGDFTKGGWRLRFNFTHFNTSTYFELDTETSSIECKVAGYYLVNLSIPAYFSATGWHQISLVKLVEPTSDSYETRFSVLALGPMTYGSGTSYLSRATINTSLILSVGDKLQIHHRTTNTQLKNGFGRVGLKSVSGTYDAANSFAVITGPSLRWNSFGTTLSSNASKGNFLRSSGSPAAMDSVLDPAELKMDIAEFIRVSKVETEPAP